MVEYLRLENENADNRREDNGNDRSPAEAGGLGIRRMGGRELSRLNDLRGQLLALEERAAGILPQHSS